LDSRGYETACTRTFESVDLPDPDAVDLLVVLGGPMSVNDESQFPWLVAEKRFVRAMVERGTPVLGICLGAQMIASAMGAKVFANPVREIGWLPVHAVPSSGGAATFAFPPSQMAFHWHGETFELPRGAVRLARSEGCENQAFQLGARAIGLQYHLETTPQSAHDLVIHCRNELVPSTYVQTAEEILAAKPTRYRSINDLMGRVLCFLTGTPATERAGGCQ
jgi:GMP synthase-like glutamine amidotransferase